MKVFFQAAPIGGSSKRRKPNPHEVTRLLLAWSEGDKAAMDKLMPLVYGELRRLAKHHMRRERAGRTLQTTALIHEAFCG
jgi:hypothetical protein